MRELMLGAVLAAESSVSLKFALLVRLSFNPTKEI